MERIKKQLGLIVKGLAYIWAFGLILFFIFYNLGWTPEFVHWVARRTNHYDKIGHLIFPGLLAFCINLVIPEKKIRGILWGSTAVAIGITLEEFRQILSADRSFDLIDLILSYISIFTSEMIGRFLNRKSKT